MVQTLKEVIKGDHRVKKIEFARNRSLGYARNVGMDASNGEFIMFLDADDYLQEDTIENLLNSIIQKNVDILLYNGVSFNHSNREIIQPKYFILEEPYFTRRKVKVKYFMQLANSTSACLKIYRSSFIITNHFFSGWYLW